MDFVGVCIEVAEALLLYITQLSGKFGTPGLDVCVSMEPGARSSRPRSYLAKCKVQADGLGAFFLDGSSFLQKLATSAKKFRHLICAAHQSDSVQLQCCSVLPGRSSMACYSVEGWEEEGGGKLIVRDYMQQEPSGPLTNSIIFTLKAPHSWQDVSSEVVRLERYLHLLHIVNPEVGIRFEEIDSRGESKLCAEQKPETFRVLLKTSFKLATELHHYTESENMSNRRGKLRLLKGGTVLLPACVPLGDNTVPEDLLFSCLAALVPPTLPGELVEASTHCSHVHVYVFGPTMLPLLIAGSQGHHLLPSLWADWSQYRLRLTSDGNHSSTGSVLVPSLCYKVENSSHSHSSKRVLHLFIFLERKLSLPRRIDGGGGDVGGGNDQWAYLMDLTASVRANFSMFVPRCADRIVRAVHGALNKLLHNHSSCLQISSRVEKVVPVLSEAVASIIQHSTTQTFKMKCRSLLQVEAGTGLDGVKTALSQKLARIAHHKLGLGPSLSSSKSVAKSMSINTLAMEQSEGDESLVISESRTSVSRHNDTLFSSSQHEGLSADDLDGVSRGRTCTVEQDYNMNGLEKDGRAISEIDFNDLEQLSNEEEGSLELESRTQDEADLNDLEELNGEDEETCKKGTCRTQGETFLESLEPISFEKEWDVREEQEDGMHEKSDFIYLEEFTSDEEREANGYLLEHKMCCNETELNTRKQLGGVEKEDRTKQEDGIADFNNPKQLGDEEDKATRVKEHRMQDGTHMNYLKRPTSEENETSRTEGCGVHAEMDVNDRKLLKNKDRELREDKQHIMLIETCFNGLEDLGDDKASSEMEDETGLTIQEHFCVEGSETRREQDYRMQDETELKDLKHYGSEEEVSRGHAYRKQDETHISDLEQLSGNGKREIKVDLEQRMQDSGNEVTSTDQECKMQDEIFVNDDEQCDIGERDVQGNLEFKLPSGLGFNTPEKLGGGGKEVDLHRERGCLMHAETDFIDLEDLDGQEIEQSREQEYLMRDEMDFNILEELGGHEVEQSGEQECLMQDETDFNDLEELVGVEESVWLSDVISRQLSTCCAQPTQQRTHQCHVPPELTIDRLAQITTDEDYKDDFEWD